MNCDENVRMVISDHEFLLQDVHIDDQEEGELLLLFTLNLLSWMRETLQSGRRRPPELACDEVAAT